jgi:MFS family permease
MSTVPSPGRGADIVGRAQDRLQHEGRRGERRKAWHMWASLITVVPIGLALGLLTFGRYAGHTPAPATPGRVLPVAILTLLLGPVALSALGVFTWLLLLLVLVGLILMAAMLRTPPTPPLQH